MNYKILVVEDEKNIRDFLSETLQEKGYIVKSTADGIVALKQAQLLKFDLVILDLSIKNISGENVCINLKKKYPTLPIIILTARSSTKDIIHGLDIGADDYVSKPFEVDELLARIKVRLKQNTSSILEIADLEMNTSTFEVYRQGKLISLTSTEFKLLEYLIANRGIVLNRETILDRIWTYSHNIETRIVDVYIGYLRKKIDTGHNKKLIHCIRGFGYTIRS